MKKNFYSHQFDNYLVNYINAILLKLTDEQLEIWKTENWDSDLEFKHKLIRYGFLVGENINQKERLNELMKSAKQKALHFTVCVTANCNFNCEYCFVNREDHPYKGEVSFEILDKIYESIKMSQEVTGIREIYVVYFGGEPLMAFDKICYMDDKLQQLAKEKKFKVIPTIVTNGSLLSKYAKELVNKNVYINVVLDINHSKTRPYKDGRDSWDDIIKGIQDILDYGKEYEARIDIASVANQEEMDLWPQHRENLKKLFSDKVTYVPECRYDGFQTAEDRLRLFETTMQGRDKDSSIYYIYFGSYICPNRTQKHGCFFTIDGVAHKCETGAFNNSAVAGKAGELIEYLRPRKEKCENCSFLPLCWNCCPDETCFMSHTFIENNIKYFFEGEGGWERKPINNNGVLYPSYFTYNFDGRYAELFPDESKSIHKVAEDITHKYRLDYFPEDIDKLHELYKE